MAGAKSAVADKPLTILYCAEISEALDKIPVVDWPSHVDDPQHRLYGHPLFLMPNRHTQHIGISNKPNPDWIKSHKLMLRYGLVEPRSYGATNERRSEEKEKEEKGAGEICSTRPQAEEEKEES